MQSQNRHCKTPFPFLFPALAYQELGDDDPGSIALKIRAAVSVLVLLEHIYVWPGDNLENNLQLAISRLEEILPMEYSGGAEKQIRAEIAVLKARLERKADKHLQKVKWWHFEEETGSDKVKISRINWISNEQRS